MRTLTINTVVMSLVSVLTGCSSGATEEHFEAMLVAQGTEYLKLRNAAIASHEQFIPAEAAGVDAKYLSEVIVLRQQQSPWITAFDRLVAEDSAMRENNLTRAQCLAQEMPSYAPLATGILELVGKNKANSIAMHHLALAGLEYLWKLADEEYDVFNILVVFNRRDLMQEVSDAVLPQVARRTVQAKSERVAIEALRLFYKYEIRSNDLSVIEEVLHKHWDVKKIRLLSRAILKKYPNSQKAQLILEKLDERRQQEVDSEKDEGGVGDLQRARELLEKSREH